MSNKVKANVRGTERVVYLGDKLDKNKWRARIIVDNAGMRTSVSGVFQTYSNGSKRFTPSPNSVNSWLL